MVSLVHSVPPAWQRVAPGPINFLTAAAILAASAAVLVTPSLSRAEQPAVTKSANCSVPTVGQAKDFLQSWQSALATHHPDKVTRLFATQGTLDAFTASGERAGYDAIRDYFVYFLVTQPVADFSTLTLDTGCGYVVAHGRTVWQQVTEDPALRRDTPVRLSLLFAETKEGWRLLRYADVRDGAISMVALQPVAAPAATPTPTATISVRAPAVASYVQRASPTVSAASSSQSRPSSAAPAKTDAAPPQESWWSSNYKPGRWVGSEPVFD